MTTLVSAARRTIGLSSTCPVWLIRQLPGFAGFHGDRLILHVMQPAPPLRRNSGRILTLFVDDPALIALAPARLPGRSPRLVVGATIVVLAHKTSMQAGMKKGAKRCHEADHKESNCRRPPLARLLAFTLHGTPAGAVREASSRPSEAPFPFFFSLTKSYPPYPRFPDHYPPLILSLPRFRPPLAER